MKTPTADVLVDRALLPRERQNHTAWRPLVQGQAHADAHMVAHRLRAFHSRNASALIAFAHVKRGTFLRLFRELAQQRLHDVVDIKTGLVTRPQPTGGRAEPPLAFFTLDHVATVGQGARQAQHGAVVQAGAPAEFGQRQVPLANSKGLHHLQGTGDGDDAAFMGLVIGLVLRSRTRGHELRFRVSRHERCFKQ